MLTAIIVAGGSSQRMGFDKLFARLGQRMVVAHSLAAFEETKSVEAILLVANAARLAQYETLMREEKFGKVRAIIAGGERRQDSVARGLAQLTAACDFVAVHDAARPLIRQAMIEKIFAAAQSYGGAASGQRVVDTLKRVDAKNFVVGGVARENLFAVETPQIFRRELLQKAFRNLSESGTEVTDEISAVERMGGAVVLLPNEEPNFKITYPADLARAEMLLRERATSES